ncbi:hypothetical protein BD769DRAFT_1491673 [Suillus cothurnatus]|nr:hypothetical protein BD769DRAFT_1491673 [Suillus cothurnatus]
MADECTASTMNWLNSALRSSLKSSTIVNQVQVWQWALMDPEHVCVALLFFHHLLTILSHRPKRLSRNQQSSFVTWTVLCLMLNLIVTVIKGNPTICKWWLLTCRTLIRTQRMTG